MRTHSLATVCILAVGCRPEPQQIHHAQQAQRPSTVSVGQAQAVIAASEWYVAQGGDPNSAEFTPIEVDSGWRVHVDFLPPRIGGHCALTLDEDFKALTSSVAGRV